MSLTTKEHRGQISWSSNQERSKTIFGAPVRYNSGLHYYSIFVAAAILLLICSGGLVTSNEAGLTVPDWPTTYGYNMFAFPVSRWVGGIFYEHTHRLFASAVGFLTLILTIWAVVTETRTWVKYLALAASVAVIFQGVLGGLRVVWLKDYLGIFHACLAQGYLVLVSIIALITSKAWIYPNLDRTKNFPRVLAIVSFGTVLCIYIQLALGATMRHQHAGLSIPDFPLAYGQVWPSTDPDSLTRINVQRSDVLQLPPTTPLQIHLQMTHRLMALLIGIGVTASALIAFRKRRSLSATNFYGSIFWPLLIAIQIVIGSYVIWTKKAADIATLHVATGAVSLLWGALLTTSAFRNLFLQDITQ